jgi:hypothetical protein
LLRKQRLVLPVCHQTHVSPRNSSAAALVVPDGGEREQPTLTRKTNCNSTTELYRQNKPSRYRATRESNTPRKPRPAQIHAEILLHWRPGVKESNDLPKRTEVAEPSAARSGSCPRRGELERGEGIRGREEEFLEAQRSQLQ